MTNDEAEIITAIMVTADHECHVCGSELLRRFIRKFPEHRLAATLALYKEHADCYDEPDRTEQREWCDRLLDLSMDDED